MRRISDGSASPERSRSSGRSQNGHESARADARQTGQTSDVVLAAAQVLRDPLQTVPEFHRSAGRVIAIKVFIGSGDDREDSAEVRVLRSKPPAIARSPVRSPEHPNVAVRPGLPGDPVQRVFAVAVLLNRWLEDSLARVPAPYILHDQRESTVQEHSVARNQVEALAVRCSNEQRWIPARPLREETRSC